MPSEIEKLWCFEEKKEGEDWFKWKKEKNIALTTRWKYYSNHKKNALFSWNRAEERGKLIIVIVERKEKKLLKKNNTHTLKQVII